MRKLSARLLLIAAIFSAAFTSARAAASQRASGIPDHTEILRTRVEKILPDAMRRYDLDCWIVFTRETARDPVAAQIGGGSVVAKAAFIFLLDKSGEMKRIAIVAGYDSAGPIESGIYNQIIAYQDEGIKNHLRDVIKEADPKRIGLDYSQDDPMADGLTVGMREYLEDCLGSHYAKRFVPAEGMLASFLGRRLSEEIEFYRRAVELTQQILFSALSDRAIAPGETTIGDLLRFLQDRTRDSGAEVAFVTISVDPSRGASTGSKRIITRGCLVHIDFGISYGGYKTDIQRTAYLLKDGERRPPKNIEDMWQTALKANRAAVRALKPGAIGMDVDRAARKVVSEGGCDEYAHVTGHAVGFEVHDEGAVLGPDWKDRYGSRVSRPIELDQMYAVEPSVQKSFGSQGVMAIGLEEDVVIEADGARYLGAPQTELILIR